MALITANQLVILSMKGHLGNVVVYPHAFKPGLFVMRSKGTRQKTAAPAEVAAQEQFKKASAYAKMAKEDPTYLKVQAVTHRTAFNLAMANFLNAPVVLEIDLREFTGKTGETIRVEATDDFEVVRVRLRLLELNGAVLEDGSAEQNPASATWWTYRVRREIPAGQTIMVEAVASDQPGNQAMKRVDHACGPRPS